MEMDFQSDVASPAPMRSGATKKVSGDSKIRSNADTPHSEHGRRVAWIDWDSGFRGSGLAVGDLIVGAADRLYDQEDTDKHRAIGAAHESTFWDPTGLGDGSKTTVLVRPRWRGRHPDGPS